MDPELTYYFTCRSPARDLDFTILGEEMVPAELATMIEERKGETFKMTYSDNKNLYICVGYGRQETGGYSITVDELYLTEEAIHCLSVFDIVHAPDAGGVDHRKVQSTAAGQKLPGYRQLGIPRGDTHLRHQRATASQWMNCT